MYVDAKCTGWRSAIETWMAQFAAASAVASERANERSLSVTASKSGLRASFKARTSEREGHANAARYQRPRTRFTRAFSSLIACVLLLSRNMRASFLRDVTCSIARIGPNTPGTLRTKRKHRLAIWPQPVWRSMLREKLIPAENWPSQRRDDEISLHSLLCSLITFFSLSFSIRTLCSKSRDCALREFYESIVTFIFDFRLSYLFIYYY